MPNQSKTIGQVTLTKMVKVQAATQSPADVRCYEIPPGKYDIVNYLNHLKDVCYLKFEGTLVYESSFNRFGGASSFKENRISKPGKVTESFYVWQLEKLEKDGYEIELFNAKE